MDILVKSSTSKKTHDNDSSMYKLVMNMDIKMCCRKLNFPFLGNYGENDSSLSYKSHRRRGSFIGFNTFVLIFCIVILLFVTYATADISSVRTVGKFLFIIFVYHISKWVIFASCHGLCDYLIYNILSL